MAAAYGLPLALLLALAVLDATALTNDPDCFWHLSAGRSAIASRSTLPVDVFSYSFAGRPWHYKDLLGDVLMYAGFPYLGYGWLLLLKVASLVTMACACHVVVRPRDRSPVVLLGCAGLIIDSYWPTERPNLFALGFFAVAVALIEQARRVSEVADTKAIARAVLPILVLNFVWSSIHTFAVLGYLLAAGFAGTLVLSRLVPNTPLARSLLGPRPSVRFMWAAVLVAVLSPVAGLANPSGVYLWEGVFAVAKNTELRDMVLEWRRLSPAELFTYFPTATVTILIALVVAAGRVLHAARLREQDPPISAGPVAALIAVAAMAGSSVRWLPYAATIAPLYLAMILGDALSQRSGKLPRGAVFLVASVLFLLLRVRQGDSLVAIGEDPEWSPRGALAFATQSGLRGDVANSMEFGGYVIFASSPAVKVLVDGRGVYPREWTVECLKAERDEKLFDEMRAADGATWALAVNRPDQVAFGFLAHDPAWRMVYWSDTAAIYVREGAHPDLAPFAYHFVNPNDVTGSVARALVASKGAPVDVAAILAEVRRMLDASPDSIRANLALAAVLAALGPDRHRDLDALLGRILVLTHDSPQMEAFAQKIRSGESERK